MRCSRRVEVPMYPVVGTFLSDGLVMNFVTYEFAQLICGADEVSTVIAVNVSAQTSPGHEPAQGFDELGCTQISDQFDVDSLCCKANKNCDVRLDGSCSSVWRFQLDGSPVIHARCGKRPCCGDSGSGKFSHELLNQFWPSSTASDAGTDDSTSQVPGPCDPEP